ncbi:glycoside hydrolase family 28 protein [Amanita thiersii Skay4041]|uniref:galacturonan 1,4-alpha-galacturonidase n=1 Tax=Amanita thiersii Skay4041 TaxID=703135 RepID=A0A2A9NJ91_9AGAR|nr:glycoside hydrolase family 28 protein [Amanita thiersii Skay4041]
MQLPLTLFLVHLTCVHGWKTLRVPHAEGRDDTPTLTALLHNFTMDSTILFEEGHIYNIWTPLAFPSGLQNVEIRIEGNLTYPDDITTVQGIVGSSSFPGAWFSFNGGTNVTLRGSRKPNWGWVDGHGQAWWDVNEQTNRPHGWSFKKITNGVIRDMKIWKPVAWNFATSGSVNLHAFNNRISALSDTDVRPFRLSFSAGGTNMLFEDNFIQNGDDCLTIGSGAKNIHFRNSYCEGGHGLSIGSLGKGGSVADVQDVLIENVIMRSTLYGARFKSWTGGNGLARNITWRNIALEDIYITQNYWDQGVGPKTNSSSINNTRVQDFLFDGFFGTIRDIPYVEGSCVTDPCWYAVPGATGKEVAILDLYPDTASNVIAKDIFARTQTGSAVAVMCNSTTVTNDVGFKCWNGPFVRTSAGF